MGQVNPKPSSEFKQLKEDKDYLIYNDGRLYSKKTNRFLKGKIDNVGYQVYALAISDKISDKGKRLSKMCYAHRLVAEYFLENPNNLPQVDHIDNNKLNNHVSNLRWVTQKENNMNKRNFGRRKPQYYKKNLPNEEWIIFPQNEMYSVSSKGRVRNNRTNRLLHQDDTQTYTRVSLNDKKHYYIHRMVYCSFHNDWDLDGFVIDHIDANPKNNSLENLQKITQSENCLKQKRFND